MRLSEWIFMDSTENNGQQQQNKENNLLLSMQLLESIIS